MLVLNSIEKRAAKLVKDFDYDKRTRQELRMQYVDHISNLKYEYMENGLDDAIALTRAIADFGNNEKIQPKQNIYVNSTFRKVLLILLILSISFIAVCFLNPVTNEGQAAKTARSFGYMYSIKLIPFKTMGLMFTRNSPYVFWFLYILLFIPLGVSIPFGINKYFNNSLIFKSYLIPVIAVQVIRMIFPVGLVNVDIAILNFIGCVIGFLIYRYIILKIALKNKLICQTERL